MPCGRLNIFSTRARNWVPQENSKGQQRTRHENGRHYFFFIYSFCFNNLPFPRELYVRIYIFSVVCRFDHGEFFVLFFTRSTRMPPYCLTTPWFETLAICRNRARINVQLDTTTRLSLSQNHIREIFSTFEPFQNRQNTRY